MATRTLRLLPIRIPARRAGRFALAAAVVVVGVLVAVRLGVGVYVNSPRGKAAVGKELQSLIGLPVEVADVDLGAHTSAVKFRVLDPRPAGPRPVEVLAVESATADVSFAEVVASRIAPKRVELSGVVLTLRVADDGTIRTPIPPPPDGPAGTTPHLVVDRLRVVVWQDGAGEFAVAGVGVRVEPAGDAVRLTGTIDDPVWGTWSIAGHLDRPTRAGWVEFTTAGELPWERRRAIPFVPAGAWYGVGTRGGLTIRVTFRNDSPQFEITAAK